MRIIGGQAKRREIRSPAAAHGVRPILSRIKKSLFDILRPRLTDAHFLDLYAGSGAVGIEALSRGAAHATFVELNPNCASVIRKNLSVVQLFDRARVVRADATRDLSHLCGPAGLPAGRFDLIFMGPPYHDLKWNMLTLTQPTLSAIERGKILKPGGWVIGQHHMKEPAVNLPHWRMFRQEKYGDTRLSFFEYAD
jgi:16S rRNA (guanine966-N2)-methyltransferase